MYNNTLEGDKCTCCFYSILRVKCNIDLTNKYIVCIPPCSVDDLPQIMDHGAAVSWDDIAGLHFAKATIKEIVVWPMLRP